MLKNILKTSALTFILLNAGSVLAVGSSATVKADISATMKPPTTTVNAIKAKLMEVRDNVKDNIQRRTENRYEKMLARYKATIERENTILLKINSRIAKIKANGGNTTEAEKLTASAKVHMDAAAIGLVTLTQQANAQANLENASTTVAKLREGIDAMKKTGAEIERHLRSAHQDLQKCVGILMGMSQIRANATTSAKVKVESN